VGGAIVAQRTFANSEPDDPLQRPRTIRRQAQSKFCELTSTPDITSSLGELRRGVKIRSYFFICLICGLSGQR
jgi:hypothetical protein